MKTITEFGHDGKKHDYVLLSEYEKQHKQIAELKEALQKMYESTDHHFAVRYGFANQRKNAKIVLNKH